MARRRTRRNAFKRSRGLKKTASAYKKRSNIWARCFFRSLEASCCTSFILLPLIGQLSRSRPSVYVIERLVSLKHSKSILKYTRCRPYSLSAIWFSGHDSEALGRQLSEIVLSPQRYIQLPGTQDDSRWFPGEHTDPLNGILGISWQLSLTTTHYYTSLNIFSCPRDTPEQHQQRHHHQHHHHQQHHHMLREWQTVGTF